MALILKTTTPSGVSANYHKIANLMHNTIENKYSAVLYTYVNKHVRDKDCHPVWARGIEISYSVEGENDVTNITFGAESYKNIGKISIIDFTRSNLYTILKSLPGMDKAQDHIVDTVVNQPPPDDQNIPI